MKNWLHLLSKNFVQSTLHFVYPTQCLHCGEVLHPNQPLLCEACLSLLEILNPQERCAICFNPIESMCFHCRHGEHIFYRSGAVFDYMGPAASLIKKLKYGNRPNLAEGIAAFMVAQFDQLNWPLPDAIIPVPLAFSHWVERGYNQSALIAQHMAKLLQVPFWDALKRKSGDYSQAGLPFEQRKALTSNCFKTKGKFSFEDKTLLLVDDVMTTGTTLKRCAEVIATHFPGPLYALTFCRTLEEKK